MKKIVDVGNMTIYNYRDCIADDGTINIFVTESLNPSAGLYGISVTLYN